MAKKAEVKKIRPSDAVRSLEEYNNRILLLIGTCEMLLINNLIDERVSNSLQEAVDSVNEFHSEN